MDRKGVVGGSYLEKFDYVLLVCPLLTCYDDFMSFVLCSGLFPPEVPGQPSGRATIYRLLQIICEETPRAARFISGEPAEQETHFPVINLRDIRLGG